MLTSASDSSDEAGLRSSKIYKVGEEVGIVCIDMAKCNKKIMFTVEHCLLFI